MKIGVYWDLVKWTFPLIVFPLIVEEENDMVEDLNA
jgi:hypothetical protein